MIRKGLTKVIIALCLGNDETRSCNTPNIGAKGFSLPADILAGRNEPAKKQKAK